MATMNDIDRAAQEYSETHNALADQVETLEREIAKLKRGRLRTIRALVEKTAMKKATLRGLIDESRAQFERPKTRIMHGVRVGLMKGKGEITINDAEQTIKLIKKHLADVAEQLIITRETVSKIALAGLPAADLKRIGVVIDETGDQIVIKPTDSEIDKLVDALLCESDEPEAA